MGLLNRLTGREETGVETIEADKDLFTSLQEHLPDQPLVRLRPHEGNPGLQSAPELIRSLYQYRQDQYGRNVSPANAFEIWFDEGQIRFYFHPETREMKNSGKKHIEDKYPGTRMVEEQDPFPEICDGDHIAAAKMTLSQHCARPLRTVGGSEPIDRDPYGSLTSEMVVEGERTQAGHRVKAEDVKMVVQVVFQPISRSWSRGGVFGTNLNDYADKLKQPKQKENSTTQLMRAVFGLEPAMREPTQKMRKSARQISELKGEPAFIADIRIMGISPYPEISRQHVRGVVEEFENYNNPVTEQTLQMQRLNEAQIKYTLEQIAGRELETSVLEKLSSLKDVFTVPELSGIIHIPNQDIHTPNVDWTKMEKGSGVPTTMPDMDDVQQEMDAKAHAQAQDDSQSPDSPSAEQEIEERMEAVDDFEETPENIDLTITTDNEYLESDGHPATPDGRGLEIDESIQSEEDVAESVDPVVDGDDSEDENKEENQSEDDSEDEPEDGNSGLGEEFTLFPEEEN
ncbi:hypothetical protein HLRTI_000402 [Halorhabdus tiamatea SARL4B]|uniref:DUF8128 domain-containing protein n=1 Tax=Halorhabdus tiamatea SARL4B TaxID=1033806 RepID=U2E618_9EURY|nr:hypothetical protein [Halorhabdus tiamatea]ERJ07361.1 hypothetical protein HLRTI_000402 [Halorhabdus tiamatea SARL4B]